MSKKEGSVFKNKNIKLLRRYIFSGLILGVLVCILFFWANSLSSYPNGLEWFINFVYVLALSAGYATFFLLIIDSVLAIILVNYFDAQIDIPIDLDFALFPDFFIDMVNAVAIIGSYVLLSIAVYAIHALFTRMKNA